MWLCNVSVLMNGLSFIPKLILMANIGNGVKWRYVTGGLQ